MEAYLSTDWTVTVFFNLYERETEREREHANTKTMVVQKAWY